MSIEDIINDEINKYLSNNDDYKCDCVHGEDDPSLSYIDGNKLIAFKIHKDKNKQKKLNKKIYLSDSYDKNEK